jgi:hypothetical protein
MKKVFLIEIDLWHAPQGFTALPARYQRLAFEFPTPSKKITFATGPSEKRFGSITHVWLDRK